MATDASGLPWGLLAGLGPGSTVAGYQVEDRLGVGGMAVVFRARDVRLGRLVALKVLAPALAADQEFRTRFIREWRAATAVEHPHIIPVYAADEAGDVLYIAMRLVSGGDLRTLLRREGPLAPQRAAGLVSSVAAALDAAHAVGLVHRDVKPGNILIDSMAGLPDHVYLSDFGLSKGMMSSAGLTGTGQFLGTPDFAAPEQIAGKRVDGRVDQYALACVAFTLLTARPVFPRDAPMSVLFAHVQDPPPSAAALRPGLPPAVDEVIARALAKSPGDRYLTCGEFAAALRAAVSVVPGADGSGQAGITWPRTDESLERSATVSAARPGVPSRTGPSWVPGTSTRAASGSLEETGPRAPGPAPTPGPTPTPTPGKRHGLARHGSRRTVIAAAAVVLAAAAATAAFVLSPDHGAGHSPQAGASSPPARNSTAASASSARAAASPAAPAATELKSLANKGGFILAFGDANRLVSISAPAGNGDKPATVSAWNLASPQAAPAQFGVPDGDNSLSPAGSLTYGGDVSTNAVPNYVWDTASGRKVATVPLSFKEDAPISDTGVLAFTGQTGVTLWNAHSGTVTGFLPYPAAYNPAHDATITISADGSMVALTSTTGKTYVWSSRTHEITATLTDPAPSALGDHSEFSADGSALAIQASASAGPSSTYIWNLADQSLPRALHNFLALSANGKLAAVANDSAVNLVEIASGKVVRTLNAPSGTGPVSVAAFSPDDTQLAAGDFTVNYVWNLAG